MHGCEGYGGLRIGDGGSQWVGNGADILTVRANTTV